MPQLQPAELVTITSNILVALSALAVAIIGAIGLNQWRAELKGRTKFEVARKAALLAFQFQNEFQSVRSAFTHLGESAGREKIEGETKGETHVLDERYARMKRLEVLRQTLLKLRETKWEAEIILGNDISNLFHPIEASYKELWASMEVYFNVEFGDANRGNQPSNVDKDWLKSQFQKVYSLPDDDFGRAVDSAVKNLVDGLKMYLK